MKRSKGLVIHQKQKHLPMLPVTLRNWLLQHLRSRGGSPPLVIRQLGPFSMKRHLQDQTSSTSTSRVIWHTSVLCKIRMRMTIRQHHRTSFPAAVDLKTMMTFPHGLGYAGQFSQRHPTMSPCPWK